MKSIEESCQIYYDQCPILLHAGLRFQEVADAEVWHGDVSVFSVFDLSSGELLGYFYLDIYMRFASYLGF
jgi:hypothetical protein